MLSFVIPVYNEEESLGHFYDALMEVAPSLDLPADRQGSKFEVIFVDDGSNDSSLEILKSLEEKNAHVKVFSFRRNLGKAEALTFGFMKAEGDYIVTLDADLQDKPTEIHKLLDKAKNGIDVVCGWRRNRRDSKNSVLSSKFFNKFAEIFWGLKLHDYNCGLKVYTKDAAKSLYLYGGMHRFIPLLAYQDGFSVDEVAIIHEERKYGESKYEKGFVKLIKNLPDMFTMLFIAKYSKRPLHFFGVAGGTLLLIGFAIFAYLGFWWLMGHSIGTRPLFFTSILLILVGFQIFFTGFLADLMINIAHSRQLLDESHTHFPLKYTSEK